MRGSIIELLECDENLFTAVEVTAGNRFVHSFFNIHLWNCLLCNKPGLCFLCSLFHVVVENDEISTQVIRHLNAEKGGRVTFIPLNRVKAPHVSYPQSSDVIPLLEKLTFSSKHNQAFRQVSNRP